MKKLFASIMLVATPAIASDVKPSAPPPVIVSLSPADAEELGANLVMAARGCATKPDTEVLACEQRVVAAAVKLETAINQATKPSP